MAWKQNSTWPSIPTQEGRGRPGGRLLFTTVRQGKTCAITWWRLYELRNTNAPACLLEVDFHDSETGVAFLTKRRNHIAEAIAKVIIEADGKEFVPVTPGEYVDRAVDLGLFSRDVDWNGPLTREEAAILALRLKDLLERG